MAADIETRLVQGYAGSTVTVEDVPPMASCVRESLALDREVDAVAGAVEELARRLYQVLVPEGPEADGAGTPREVTSPLHDSIRTSNERLGRIENRIHDIMGRLTV